MTIDTQRALEESDIEIVERVNGLYVGQLSEEELQAFSRCVLAGKARRNYGEGAQWLCGIAKVQVIHE
jgi:hypothetical protein